MKEPTIEITYNGMKYYSEVALAENQLKWYNLGKAVGIEEGKKANGYSSDDIKKLHTDMNHIHHLWYDKGYNAGKSEGYEIGKKANGISTKEIPGEWLSRIEEARLMGYEQGRSDCREATLQKKLLQEHIMYYGRDEEGPVQTEYDKGFTKGYEEGRSDIMQFIANEEGKKEATLEEKVDQFNKGYEIGKYEGYEEGKKAGYNERIFG